MFVETGETGHESWVAGGISVLGVAWSVPNYQAAMPSWYLLFLGTLGTLALSKYVTQTEMRWLILAALFPGTSFLFKSVGVYFIAGALFFSFLRSRTFLEQPLTGRKCGQLRKLSDA